MDKNIIMNTAKNYKYNNFILFSLLLFSFSLGTSKAGIHISSVLLFGIFIITFKKTFSLMSSKNKNILYLCYTFYILEALLSYVLHSSHDLTKFLDTNAFLLILPIVSHFLDDKNHRKYAILSFIVGVCLSALFSVYNFIFVHHFSLSARALGFMDYSRHINALILVFCLMLAFIKNNNNNIITPILIILITISSVIISGTRGGWLSFIVTTTVYFLIYYRKYILHFFIVAVISMLLIFITDNPISNYIGNRISSITDVHETSNSIRLTIWKNGIKYLSSTLQNNPIDFLFGSGMMSSSQSYIDYVNSQPQTIKEQFLLDGNLYGSTDFHNAILDIFIKSGAVYSIFILSMIGLLIKKSWFSKNRTYLKDSLRLYSVGILSIFPFYSLLQDYSMYTITFALALSLTDFEYNAERLL